jgi:hypothetical protein
MEYSLSQPPLAADFWHMSRKELRAYNAWFHEVTPERIGVLGAIVGETPGYEDWQPDGSPDSLEALGEWFRDQAGTRALTPEEVEAIRGELEFTDEESARELDARTISLALDIAMYVSQVFVKNHPSLKWHQDLRSKSSIDYGQPLLIGFADKVPLNPVGVVLTIAYSFADKSRPGGELRELYDIWSVRAPAA